MFYKWRSKFGGMDASSISQLNDDPLFPATRIMLGSTRQIEAAGLERTHWSSAGPIRKVFRESFQRAGLPYFHPHSLRKTLARLGEQLCQSPEQC